MRLRKTSSLSVVALFLVLVVLGCGGDEKATPPAIGPYTLKIVPETATVTLDEEVSVDIVVSNVEDLYAAELRLGFNSDATSGDGAVEVAKVQEGTFLSENDAVTTFFIKEHPVGGGYVEINTSRAASTGVTSEEDQVLATVTFKGTAVGTTALQWTTTDLYDSTQPDGKLIDPNDFTAVGGEITVE